MTVVMVLEMKMTFIEIFIWRICLSIKTEKKYSDKFFLYHHFLLFSQVLDRFRNRFSSKISEYVHDCLKE